MPNSIKFKINFDQRSKKRFINIGMKYLKIINGVMESLQIYLKKNGQFIII